MKGQGLNITVLYSPSPRLVREWPVTLAEGSTLAQALAACGVFEAFPQLKGTRLALGVWGQKTTLGHVLQDLDRIEIYRGLGVDPKVARRERFNRQGAKGTGLFANKRAGAKAGY